MAFDHALKRIFVSLVLIALSSSLLAEESDRWVFRVYLDDREIGFHEFSVTENEGEQRIDISAQFDVKVLFFNAYSYEHRNTEKWRGNCLSRIEALTNDNGTDFAVKGQSAEAGFEVSVNDERTRMDTECIRTFAYWNPIILQDGSLLNSQTGEVINVTVREHGAVELDLGANRVPAEKFTIEMEGGPIHLWYSPGVRLWLALEAETEGGRTLRYVPVALPRSEAGENRLAMD